MKLNPVLGRAKGLPRPGLLRALLAAWLCFWGVLGVRADDRSWTDGLTIDTYHPSWMSWVSNSVRLSELSVPGTHDTMSLYWGWIVSTHSLTLSQQLNAGIRALDIRARHEDDRFRIYHGSTYQLATFDDVLEDCNTFLAANPSETIFMFFGDSGVPDPDNVTRTYQETFYWYRDSSGLGGRIWTPGTNGVRTTLGEVRGKIVIIDKGLSCGGCGWADGLFSIQDNWDLDTVFDLNGKWDDIQAHFEDTDAGTADTVYVNFLSASSSSGGVWPIDVANGVAPYDGMNPRTLEYLFAGNQTRTTGIVLTDYPGEALIDVIIAHNLKYASDPGRATRDFGYILQNLAHSLDDDGTDECLDRMQQLRTFLNFAVPNQNWSVLATSTPNADEWGFASEQAGLAGFTTEVDGYAYMAMAAPRLSGNTSSTELAAYLTDARLQTLSGTAQARAGALRQMVDTQFPGLRWNVAVKREPGGFQNWAYGLVPYASYRSSFLDDDGSAYAYLVWTTTLNNRRPTAAVSSLAYVTGEGLPLLLDGSPSRDLDGDTLVYRWDLDGNGSYDTTNSPNPYYEVSYDNEKVLNSQLLVNDGFMSAVRSFTITVTNVPGYALLGANETVVRGTMFNRTCSIVEPGQDKPQIRVDYGDGTVQDVAVSFSMTFELKHTYATEGTYQVNVSVFDGTDTTVRSLTITVVPPAGPPTFLSLASALGTVWEGSSVNVTGRFYHATWVSGTPITFTWGDGSPQEIRTNIVVSEGGGYWRFSASHVYADDVLAQITASVPGVGVRQMTVPVFNVNPTVNAPSPALGGYEGWLISRSLEIVDPGLDSWRVRIDYGDGRQSLTTNTTRSFLFQNRYQRPGTYQAVITVTDDEGGTSSLTVPVTVTNAAPLWASFGHGTNAIPEGGVLNVSGLFTSSSIDYDTFSVEINWGDGSPVDLPAVQVANAQFRSVQASHRYADNPPGGVYQITATVFDEDGGSNRWTTTIFVTNVAPTLRLQTKVATGPDLLYLSHGVITDAGRDGWTAHVDYDDGSPLVPAEIVNSSVVLKHYYAAPGLYLVSVTLRDDDGAEVKASTTVLVGPPALSITPDNAGQIALSWPQHEAPFVLQGASWKWPYIWGNITAPVTIKEGTNTVLIPPGLPYQVFRLKYTW